MKAVYYVLALLATLPVACVDAFEPEVRSTVNVLVVDGTINDLAEEQVIFLSLAKADVKTGRFGQTPVQGANVQVRVNGATLVMATEKAPGEYVLPADFRGRPGNRYQLLMTLGEGQQYQSTEQTMPRPVAINNMTAQFSTRALDSVQYDGFMAGHKLNVQFQDPPGERNYYRWDWRDFERQYFCASCFQGLYSIYKPYILRSPQLLPVYASGPELLEDCFIPPPNPFPGDPNLPPVPGSFFFYDYNCRTECWEIIQNSKLTIFNDELSDGGQIGPLNAGAVPYFTRIPCLVELRQSAITSEAYTYYKLVQDQTQNTGGVADSPPSAPIGNVRDVANPNRGVVGFFTAAAITTQRQFLDRKDATTLPRGANPPEVPSVPGFPPFETVNLPGIELFYALNQRALFLEPNSPPFSLAFTLLGPKRPPTAICRQSRTRTPQKPEGWLGN